MESVWVWVKGVNVECKSFGGYFIWPFDFFPLLLLAIVMLYYFFFFILSSLGKIKENEVFPFYSMCFCCTVANKFRLGLWNEGLILPFFLCAKFSAFLLPSPSSRALCLYIFLVNGKWCLEIVQKSSQNETFNRTKNMYFYIIHKTHRVFNDLVNTEYIFQPHYFHIFYTFLFFMQQHRTTSPECTTCFYFFFFFLLSFIHISSYCNSMNGNKTNCGWEQKIPAFSHWVWNPPHTHQIDISSAFIFYQQFL